MSAAWKEAPCSSVVILACEGISRLEEDQVKLRRKEEKLEGVVMGEGWEEKQFLLFCSAH